MNAEKTMTVSLTVHAWQQMCTRLRVCMKRESMREMLNMAKFSGFFQPPGWVVVPSLGCTLQVTPDKYKEMTGAEWATVTIRSGCAHYNPQSENRLVWV